MTDNTIRPLRRDDLADAKALIAAADLFPAEMLPEMAAPWLEVGKTRFGWSQMTARALPCRARADD